MNLYSISPDGHPATNVVAKSHSHAIDVFITYEASRERFHESLSIAAIPVTDLGAEEERQVLSAMILGIPGVLHYDEKVGWIFSSPLCTPAECNTVLPGDLEGGAQ